MTMTEIEVKALEWACSPEWETGEFVTEWFVFSVAGHYRLWHDDTVTPAVWHVSYPAGSKQPYEGTEHPNIEDAKAAAQSDFAAHIRSAIERKAEPVAWQWRKKHWGDREKWSDWHMGVGSKQSAAKQPYCDYEYRDLFALSASPSPVTEDEENSYAAVHAHTVRMAADREEENGNSHLADELRNAMRFIERTASPSPVGESRDALVERLAKALEPFAQAAEKADAAAARMGFAPGFDEYAPRWEFKLGDLREARASLLAAKEQQP